MNSQGSLDIYGLMGCLKGRRDNIRLDVFEYLTIYIVFSLFFFPTK